MPTDTQTTSRKFLWELNATACPSDLAAHVAFPSLREFMSFFNESGQRRDAATVLTFHWALDATLPSARNDMQAAFTHTSMLFIICPRWNCCVRVTNADHDAAAAFLVTRLDWLKLVPLATCG